MEQVSARERRHDEIEDAALEDLNIKVDVELWRDHDNVQRTRTLVCESQDVCPSTIGQSRIREDHTRTRQSRQKLSRLGTASDVACLDASTVQGQLERDVQALLSLYQERENLFVHQNLLHSWKSWFSGANWAPPSGHGEGRFESKLVRVFQSWFKPLVLLMVAGGYGSEREPSS